MYWTATCGARLELISGLTVRSELHSQVLAEACLKGTKEMPKQCLGISEASELSRGTPNCCCCGCWYCYCFCYCYGCCYCYCYGCWRPLWILFLDPPQDPKIMQIDMSTKSSKTGPHNLILSASWTELKGERLWVALKSFFLWAST